MSIDNSSAEIAERLHLSIETVKTHRKNIKGKLNAQSQHDIIRFTQAFDIS